MCDERERLISYLYGECDAEERERVGRHLDECGECRTEIRGLQQVREDLLAWDVPRHESVWKPFAPAATTPWWREVPAWAMAAAASLTFVVGAAGGIVTHAMTSSEPAPAAPAVVVARPGPSEVDFLALASQIENLQMALAEQNAETERLRTAAEGSGVLIGDARAEFLGLITRMNSAVAGNRREISKIQSEWATYVAGQDPGRN